MRCVFLALALLGTPASAEVPAGDPRIHAVYPEQGGLIHLELQPDAFAVLLFPPGERIATVILSDPNAYAVIVAREGDSLALRANGNRALAMMSVRTERANYEFELASGSSGDAPLVWRIVPRLFGEPSPVGVIGKPKPSAPVLKAASGQYRLSGNRDLRPLSITDDGERTYLVWDTRQALPATFAVGADGKEETVDGYVRDGVFTIDRTFSSLIFRVDRQSATARRIKNKGGGNEPG